jgi:hypothetical protein
MRTHRTAEEPSLPWLATGPETEPATRRDLAPRSSAASSFALQQSPSRSQLVSEVLHDEVFRGAGCFQ